MLINREVNPFLLGAPVDGRGAVAAAYLRPAKMAASWDAKPQKNVWK
jgi:hypothetical protein